MTSGKIIQFTKDEPVIQLGGISITKTGRKYNLINSDTGKCIIKGFNSYRKIGDDYMEIVRHGKNKNNILMKVLYSIKQNKIWDIPDRSIIETRDGLTLFIDHSGETVSDIAVFKDESGELIGRLKITQPTKQSEMTLEKQTIGKRKLLEVKLIYVESKVKKYKVEIEIKDKPLFGIFKITKKG